MKKGAINLTHVRIQWLNDCLFNACVQKDADVYCIEVSPGIDVALVSCYSKLASHTPGLSFSGTKNQNCDNQTFQAGRHSWFYYTSK
jgi:hypothetical protein